MIARAWRAGRRHEGRLLRGPLLVAGLMAALVFGVDTLLATLNAYLWWDVPLHRAVQALPWGPLVPAFELVDYFEGVRQVALGVAGLVAVLLFNRRAVPLAVVLAFSGAVYTLTEELVMRPRPDPGLVHVIRHTNGFSYPSGHAVFFTWFMPLLLLCVVRPHLPRVFEVAGWVLAVVVLALACVGRVYIGEHWPSDVLGGLALGLAWTCLAFSLRPLSDPALLTQERRASPARPLHG